MKETLNKFRGHLQCGLYVAGVLFAVSSTALPRGPLPPIPERTPICQKGFDGDYFLDDTNASLFVAGLGTLEESWSGYSLQRSGDVIPFVIPALDGTGHTNISCDTNGALRIWLKPYWSSQSAGGTGPDAIATIFELEAVSGAGSAVAWSLQIGADGNTISLTSDGGGGLQTNLQSSISLVGGDSHVLTLDYSTTGTTLYVDGSDAADGSGVPSVPASVAELVIGSTSAGTNAAQADLDEFYSFRDTLIDSEVASYYALTGNQAALGPVTGDGGFSGGRFGTMAESRSVYDPDRDGEGCVTGGPVFLTNLTATMDAFSNMTVSLDVQGGTNGVFYDLYSTTDLTGTWSWLGQVLTCNTYVYSNQPANVAFYAVSVPSETMLVAWGDLSSRPLDVPDGLTNITAMAAGGEFDLALFPDGTVRAWGDNSYGQTNIPAGLSNVVSIAAGHYHGTVLLANGSVTNWGYYEDGAAAFCSVTNRSQASAPPLSNVVAIAAGLGQDLALLSNGTLYAWGKTTAFGTQVPTNLNLTNVVGIACGWEYNVALRSDGTVATWGYGGTGPGWSFTNVPAGLSNVVAITSGGEHSLALKSDGTVVGWGYSPVGETNVPIGLSNVVAIAAGGDQSLALQADGTLVAWGDSVDADIPAGLTGVKAIACGFDHNLALRSGQLNPVILEQPDLQFALPGNSSTFTVSAYGFPPLSYQWQFNGTDISGATNSSFTLTNAQATNEGGYQVIISAPLGSITSSSAGFTLIRPPQVTSTTPALSPGSNWINGTNMPLSVVATDANLLFYPLTYQWSLNGTNITGATNSSYNLALDLSQYQTPSVTISNAAGGTNISWGAMLATLPGMAEAWGDNTYGDCERPELTNIMAIAAGGHQSVAVLDDGTVAQWGVYSDAPDYYSVDNFALSTLPPYSGVVAVAAGLWQDLALLDDGTVYAWGLIGAYGTDVPGGLAGVKAVACGWHFDVALLTNGGVVSWGENYYGQTNVPSGLTNVTAIAAGARHTLAVLSDGTVRAWGDGVDGDTNAPSGLSNVVSVAAGESFSLALKTDGTVVAWGNNDFGQTNVPAGMSNVMNIAAGDHHCLALKNDGTLVSWGDNTYGQTNRILQGSGVATKLIAAGGDHSVAALWTSFVQYPIEVSKDLLLIYNINSLDSSNVCQYYLAHRPMVGDANVLGINCATTNEGISIDDYTNSFSASIVHWLLVHPTILPQYVILFQDLPSRITNGPSTCSVQYDMNTGTNSRFHSINYFANWHPFVTSINMNGVFGTNDCIAYIDKITTKASNSLPGNIFLHPPVNYGNTNWYIDSLNSIEGESALLGLTSIFPSASVFTNIDPNYVSQATNVAAYFTCGWDCGAAFTYDSATNNSIRFFGVSDWFVISTIDSFNGQRVPQLNPNQWSFISWFAHNAFGGTNYANTPVGAVVHVDEPFAGEENRFIYFRDWASGKCLGFSAWDSLLGNVGGEAPYYACAVIGDPFTVK